MLLLLQALAMDELRQSVARGKRLKKFGNREKLDYKTCRLCLRHCKNYNSTASLDYPPVLFDVLKQYGCTPLHTWIRCMECILKAPITQLSETDNVNFTEAKRRIQARFAGPEGKGLRIYFPNPKGRAINLEQSFN